MSKRVALVIGNEDYGDNVRRLKGPKNDTIRMARLFDEMGFIVVQPQFNADKGTIRAAVRGFVETIEEGGLAVFYYSGHGIQGPGGVNYLMPIDAKLYEPVDIGDRCYAVSIIVEKLVEKRCTGLLFLDACRDDPFRGVPEGHRTMSVIVRKKGLEKVGKSALPDILISYATGPGNTAQDGDPDRSSPYTKALIEHLPTPGVLIEEVLKRVRNSVAKDTQFRQQPAYDGQLSTSNLILVPRSPIEPQPGQGQNGPYGSGVNPEEFKTPKKPEDPVDAWKQLWEKWLGRLQYASLLVGLASMFLVMPLYAFWGFWDSRKPTSTEKLDNGGVRTESSSRLLLWLGDINANIDEDSIPTTARIEASLIGTNRFNDADRLAIANGLVRMASDLSRRGLSAKGRLNLFYLLSRIDKSDWEQQSWAVIRAAARRAFLDLKNSGTDIGTDTSDILKTLKPLLFVDKEERPLVVIYANVRYGGSLTQEHALSAIGALRALNWEVRGPNGAEDTTQAAIGKNEVRYGNVSDREIAAKAVLDLQAAGYAVAAHPVPVAKFGTGPIEIWLSKLPETAQARWLKPPPSSAWCSQGDFTVTDGGQYSVRCHKDATSCASDWQQSPHFRKSACAFVAELDRSGVNLRGPDPTDSYWLYGGKPLSTPFPPLPFKTDGRFN